ncbi:(2Fe-2S)-binding protein [Maribacter sp. X9]|uniref:(2Fe-2S)-binding protein n=1 Tax=Maribacter sp. X9 TaxID=3402159 RepID=UPI003AF37034
MTEEVHKGKIELSINGKQYNLEIRPWSTLLDVLRDQLNLTGTKKGCDHGQCGACTVLIEGKAINSCLALANMQQGKEITTIEGLEKNGDLHPVQRDFIEKDAFQCGYCTSGQILSMVGLMNMEKGNSPEEIRDLMSGNICRCGAYSNIYKVAEKLILKNKGDE